MTLPRTLLLRAKMLAAEQSVSLATFLIGVLEGSVKGHDDYERAKRRALSHMRHARDLGTQGNASWTRDSLHERR
ncbi:MAG TPA: CopG family transcriptional regulator [Thermoanaerobaculia bacterium]|nr:CopG family transcriptional regulator [Thermoanaerobaculia bacterium]